MRGEQQKTTISVHLKKIIWFGVVLCNFFSFILWVVYFQVVKHLHMNFFWDSEKQKIPWNKSLWLNWKSVHVDMLLGKVLEIGWSCCLCCCNSKLLWAKCWIVQVLFHQLIDCTLKRKINQFWLKFWQCIVG